MESATKTDLKENPTNDHFDVDQCHSNTALSHIIIINKRTLDEDTMAEDNQWDVHESPKKGPTLSTSTSSFEALDPHDPNLSRLATTMFQKTADYLQGELTSTQEDYRLLEEMNRLTISKYADFHRIAGNLSSTVVELDKMFLSLGPYLEQIDAIEESVNKLEQAAHRLDSYSKKLEAKFKYLEKR